MSKALDTIVLVEKETIAGLKFPEEEVLLGQEQINNRQYEAERAMKLETILRIRLKLFLKIWKE